MMILIRRVREAGTDGAISAFGRERGGIHHGGSGVGGDIEDLLEALSKNLETGWGTTFNELAIGSSHRLILNSVVSFPIEEVEGPDDTAVARLVLHILHLGH
jgi:hypothetical protein